MTSITNIEQAERVLKKYVKKTTAYLGDDMSLVRMWPLLELLDNPQKKLKIIHIAGTSGKTSTAYYISALLQSTGAKVGLTVSPHVDSITERIQINGKNISDDEFCKSMTTLLKVVDSVDVKPSYFELLIVFMYWYFAKIGVDYAVVETGLGGTLDSTNVAKLPNKVCVITDIGRDHVQVLGSEIAGIAKQKAGIIHEYNEVFILKQSDEILSEIRNRVENVSANLNVVGEKTEANDSDSDSDTALLPEFQKRNWLLAYSVFKFILKRDKLTVKQKLRPSGIIVPGRMEEIALSDNSLLIMDGAHNEQKVSSFVQSYLKKHGNTEAVVLLSLKRGKEYEEVVDALLPIAKSFILTTFNSSQDMPAISQDPEDIYNYCIEKKCASKIIIDNKKAFKELLISDSKIKIVIGSFYLLGELRKNF